MVKKKKDKDILLGDKPEKSEVSQVEAEVIQGYRDFSVKVGNKEIFFRVFDPTVEQQAIIGDKYTEKYTELLNEGRFLLWDVLRSRLKEQGAWTDEDEDYSRKKTEEMTSVIAKYLEHVRDEKHDEKIAQQLRDRYFKIKDEMYKHSQRRIQYHLNTIESKTDNYAMKYKLLHCLHCKSGNGYKQYFKDIDEVNNFKYASALTSLMSHCMSFWAGIKQELLEDSPENDLIFGGGGLHTLLENSDGKLSTESTKTEEKVSSEKG